MIPRDMIEQRKRLRAIIAEHIDAIVVVLPTSPANTVRLTIDAVTCLVWRIGEIRGDVRDVVASVQHALNQPMQLDTAVLPAATSSDRETKKPVLRLQDREYA